MLARATPSRGHVPERVRVPTIHDLATAAEAGDGTAAAELFAALYGELRTQAESLLRNSGEQVTLGTTTLLHESYIKLADREGLRFPDRARFMAYASKALRGLLIDYVRARRARKRGGEFQIIRMGDEEFAAPQGVPDDQRLERLARALAELEKLEPRLAELVDLHFFGGFSFAEIASLRDRTPRTVQRDWRKARLLLQRLLTDE
jgi:RNA polymerase sigma factor (TIGR02999 family)